MRVVQLMGIFGLGMLALALPAFSQQMKFVHADEIFNLPELGAVLGAEAEQLKVMAVAPQDRRNKAYQDVDLQEGDLIVYLNGKRIKSIKEFEQGYTALAVGDTLQMGLRRKDDRLITAFVKADPKSLPEPKMMKMMIGGEGTVTTEGGSSGHKVVKTLDPNASAVTPILELGVIIGEVGGKVKVLDQLPLPATGLTAANLEAGDVLLQLNGQKITGASQFNQSFEKIAMGAKVDLQYQRKEKTLTASFNKPQTQGRVMIKTNNN